MTSSREAGVLSVEAIRAHFPALERRSGGRPVAYFDGPGGTQVPRAVAEAVVDYLLRHNANTHWRYPTSEETDALLADARAAVADFLGGDPSEIVFGANMTTLTFHVARALARGWREGDEVVVTELDHHANVDPWRALEREKGIVVKAIPVLPEAGAARSRGPAAAPDGTDAPRRRRRRRRTPSGRSTTSPASRRPRTRAGPSSSSTPSTTPRTSSST